MPKQEVCIIGSGLVGQITALCLADVFDVTLLEPVYPKPAGQTPARVFALSLRSCSLLKKAGLWPKLTPCASPIRHLHLSAKGAFGRAFFDASDIQADAFGYVLDQTDLTTAVNLLVHQTKNIRIIAIERVDQIHPFPGGHRLTYRPMGQDQANQDETPLLIVADGTYSPCRRLLSIQTQTHDYPQSIFVATLKTTQDHEHTAYERFTEHGAIVTLPRFGSYSSFIWTVEDGSIPHVKETRKWVELLNHEFGRRLGTIEPGDPPALFKPRHVVAREQIRPNLVLLGNASRTIHPIGAQGLNLALGDVWHLSATLREAIAQHQPFYTLSVLERFLAKRRLEQQMITQLMRYLPEIPLGRVPFRHMIAGGLFALDRMPFRQACLSRLVLRDMLVGEK